MDKQDYVPLAPGARGRLAGLMGAAEGATRLRFDFATYTLEATYPPRVGAWALTALLGTPEAEAGATGAVRVGICLAGRQPQPLACYPAGALVGLFLGLAAHHRQQARRAARETKRQQRASEAATVLALSIHNLLPNG